jgi:polyisoprenoid-binding protein YceI
MNTKLFFVLFSIAVCSTAYAQDTLHVNSCDTSFVTYRLVHPLHVVEATSKNVSFRLGIDTLKREIKNVSASVDVMTFDSNNSNRDSHAMEVVDALTYPDAVFTSTKVVQHNDTLNVTGNLDFHGVTQEIVLDAVSHWMNTKLYVDGNFNISLTAFKIERPSMLMMSVNDTLRFIFRAAFQWK